MRVLGDALYLIASVLLIQIGTLMGGPAGILVGIVGGGMVGFGYEGVFTRHQKARP